MLTAAHARTKQLGGIQHFGPHSTETSAEEWARNCCLARIIREPLNTSTFCFGTGCSTSGANKSHANKIVPAPRVANFGGDLSWRSQFLRSRANIGARRPMARAARVKTRAHSIKIHHRRRKRARRVFPYATAMFELDCRLCTIELGRAHIDGRQAIRATRRV